MKQKTCKVCKDKFTPIRQLQPTCSKMECMVEYASQHLKKSATIKKKQINKEKKAFYAKDVTTMKMKAQNAFNRYIRTRDKGQPCISCGCHVAKGDASHFYSVGGHSALRFNVNNVHLACYKCNRFLHGNLVPYKVELIKKIGQERFYRLEAQSKVIKSYTNEYYSRIISIFNKKTKKLGNN